MLHETVKQTLKWNQFTYVKKALNLSKVKTHTLNDFIANWFSQHRATRPFIRVKCCMGRVVCDSWFKTGAKQKQHPIPSLFIFSLQ